MQKRSDNLYFAEKEYWVMEKGTLMKCGGIDDVKGGADIQEEDIGVSPLFAGGDSDVEVQTIDDKSNQFA